MAADEGPLPPELHRLRRKLIVRQVNPTHLGTCSSWEAVQVGGAVDKLIFGVPLFHLYVHV